MVLRQRRIFTALLALTAAALPIGALAQSATPPDAPSYARPSYGNADEVIQGRIASFDGGYNLQLRDDRGFIDNVRLRQGTVINPTGLRLAPGMAVTIHGVNQGSVFAANEIDTPYQSYGAALVPYAYPAYPYVYPAYPYPVYGYPYGPQFSIGIGIGVGRGWGWGGAWGGHWR
jgi:hypothetical protein